MMTGDLNLSFRDVSGAIVSIHSLEALLSKIALVDRLCRRIFDIAL